MLTKKVRLLHVVQRLLTRQQNQLSSRHGELIQWRRFKMNLTELSKGRKVLVATRSRGSNGHLAGESGSATVVFRFQRTSSNIVKASFNFPPRVSPTIVDYD